MRAIAELRQPATAAPFLGDFAPQRLMRWLRGATLAGAVLTLIGSFSLNTADGVLYFLVGLGVAAGAISVRVHFAQKRREDRRRAQQLGHQLRHGDPPPTVPAAAMAAAGQYLEERESCYVDGAPAELVTWYGDPVVLQHRFFLAWGSPLAVGASVFATLFFWRRNAKKAKAARPRWRDPEPCQLWVTDRGFMVHGKKGNRSWVCFHWANIRRMWLERDGLALVVDGADVPMKLRFGSPAQSYVVANFVAFGQVVEPKPTK